MTHFEKFNEPGQQYNKPHPDQYKPKYWRCHSFSDVSEEDMATFEKALHTGPNTKTQWQKALDHAATIIYQTGTNAYLDSCLAHDVAVAFMLRIAQGHGHTVRIANYHGWIDNDEIMTSSIEGSVAVLGVKSGDTESDYGVLLIETSNGTLRGVESRFIPFANIHEIEILERN